ncbi:otolin-1-like [Ylistrum balloti]|uniref:otolin-1-like n=1 Tax=Ylistrum balloti TaxID=509963 RepID=UPI002905F710|nr:otolin-1-like [Ylistrum balloti]
MMASNILQLICVLVVVVPVACDTEISSETFSALQEQVQTLQAVFQKQQEQIHQQGETIIHLEQRIQVVEEENQVLKERLETGIQESKKDNLEQKGQSKFRKTSLQKRVSGYGLAPHSIGFSASLSTTTALGDNQIVRFDKIISNDGNGYDSRYGRFTAPITGLYAFSVTIMCSGSESYLHINIVKDGQVIGVGFANGNHFDNGSKLVVAQLQAGQMVWVQHAVDPSGYKINGDGYSSFSGFLVQAY